MTIHTNKSLKEIISNVVGDVFDIMKRSCKYGHTSYDENHIADWTCHHDCNKPNGSSWGECDMENCPMFRTCDLDEDGRRFIFSVDIETTEGEICDE